jgi:NADH:ubiquinone oxidoreductase subunit 2 (subunit N)
MAQNKVKTLLAYSSIRHVGCLFIGFSCGTIEGIQLLLIGVFIYVLMTINVFAIVLVLRQNRFKYIADLGALAKTNPILAITLSITMFSYAGIPPLAGFCSKFLFFFVALGCQATSPQSCMHTHVSKVLTYPPTIFDTFDGGSKIKHLSWIYYGRCKDTIYTCC